MRRKPLALALSSAVLLSACSTTFPQRAQPGSELMGQNLRMQTSRGQVSTLQFRNGGVVRALFGKQEIVGRWQVERGQLCFLWSGAPRECWPYARPLRRGETRNVVSDRGNASRVTLL